MASIASSASKPRLMAALSIRDLDDTVKEKLRVRAAEHGRSMEAEVRAILSGSRRRAGAVVGAVHGSHGPLRGPGRCPFRSSGTRTPCPFARPLSNDRPRHQRHFRGLMRVSPSPDVVGWVRAAGPSRNLYTTAVTVAEIGYRLARLPKGRRKERFVEAANEVIPAFSEHVLPFQHHAATPIRRHSHRAKTRGCPSMASTLRSPPICRTHNATLATRNLKDFDGTGITCMQHPGTRTPAIDTASGEIQ